MMRVIQWPILLPLIGKVAGNLDFSSYFVRLGPIPPTYAGSTTSYAALKAAGVPLLGYGAFVTAAVNFVIIAFLIFLIVRVANRLAPKPEPTAVVDPADVVLLREIRDELRKRG